MANFIREVRVSAGLTQSYLAKELGVTQGAITYWENGKRIPAMLMEENGLLEKLRSLWPEKKGQSSLGQMESSLSE